MREGESADAKRRARRGPRDLIRTAFGEHSRDRLVRGSGSRTRAVGRRGSSRGARELIQEASLDGLRRANAELHSGNSGSATARRSSSSGAAESAATSARTRASRPPAALRDSPARAPGPMCSRRRSAAEARRRSGHRECCAETDSERIPIPIGFPRGDMIRKLAAPPEELRGWKKKIVFSLLCSARQRWRARIGADNAP
jgi:hypothetical protein